MLSPPVAAGGPGHLLLRAKERVSPGRRRAGGVTGERMPPASYRLVVIAGPTAVGKSQAALELARRIPAEIVSADSRTLYRGLDIGTAKASPADRAAVPHHLLDVADPDHVVTLSEYQRRASSAIAEIRGRGRLPLLVGGTGLYIRAVIDGLAIPPVAPDWRLRSRLEQEERARGSGTLHRRLCQVDPEAAARIHPRNVRRIIRALEVYERTGRGVPAFQKGPGRRAGAGEGKQAGDARGSGSGGPALMVVLSMERARLYERIDRRIQMQIDEGWVEEVRALLRAGYPRTLPALAGLGYKEILMHLDETLTLDEAVMRLRRNTRRYAKRQGTWFRADPRYRWIDVGDDPPGAIADRLQAMLADRSADA